MAGVHAVFFSTHEDVPGAKTYGLEFADQPVLAIDRVRYFGEEVVAVVAAEEPEQARRASAAVKVVYEPLEPVTDPERARSNCTSGRSWWSICRIWVATSSRIASLGSATTRSRSRPRRGR